MNVKILGYYKQNNIISLKFKFSIITSPCDPSSQCTDEWFFKHKSRCFVAMIVISNIQTMFLCQICSHQVLFSLLGNLFYSEYIPMPHQYWGVSFVPCKHIFLWWHLLTTQRIILCGITTIRLNTTYTNSSLLSQFKALYITYI